MATTTKKTTKATGTKRLSKIGEYLQNWKPLIDIDLNDRAIRRMVMK